jgi:hypothetical protein
LWKVSGNTPILKDVEYIAVLWFKSERLIVKSIKIILANSCKFLQKLQVFRKIIHIFAK